MKRLILGAALAALCCSSALAGEVTLCSGSAGGGYDGLIQSVGVELQKADHTVTIRNFAGSENILNGIAGGQCAFGPAQGDIFYLMSKNDQSVLSKVIPVDLLYTEVMTLVCSPSSGYDELSDLAEGDPVIVDSIGSGSALTWENLKNIEAEYGSGSAWSKATPIFSPLDEAGGALATGQAKCAFGVGKVPSNWAINLVNRGYTLSYIYDKDINDLEFPEGQSLYEAVTVRKGGYKSGFDSYRVPAILFRSATAKVDPGIEKLIKRIAPSLGSQRNTVQ